MHKVADLMLEGTSLKFIHIGTATANHIKSDGFKKPALIATKFTM
jgi:aspartate/glutamate racemase